MQKLKDAFQKLLDTLINVVPNAAATIVDAFGKILTGTVNIIQSFLTTLGGLASNPKQFLTTIVGVLFVYDLANGAPYILKIANDSIAVVKSGDWQLVVVLLIALLILDRKK